MEETRKDWIFTQEVMIFYIMIFIVYLFICRMIMDQISNYLRDFTKSHVLSLLSFTIHLRSRLDYVPMIT